MLYFHWEKKSIKRFWLNIYQLPGGDKLYFFRGDYITYSFVRVSVKYDTDPSPSPPGELEGWSVLPGQVQRYGKNARLHLDYILFAYFW